MNKIACVSLGSALAVLLSGGISTAEAGTPKVKIDASDAIEVVGHLTLPESPVSEITLSQHWRRDYVILRDAVHGLLIEVDVCDPAHPSITRRLPLPEQSRNGSAVVVVGQAVLVSSTGALIASQEPGSVAIVSYAEPDHPVIVRQFANVSAMKVHRERALIYIVDSEGLWILREKPAADLELEAAYGRYVLYSH
jgi:hypothetical protein